MRTGECIIFSSKKVTASECHVVVVCVLGTTLRSVIRVNVCQLKSWQCRKLGLSERFQWYPKPIDLFHVWFLDSFCFPYCGLSRFVLIRSKGRLTWNLHLGWKFHWNGLDVPVFTAGWKPLLTKFGIHHRMESSDGVRSPIPPHCAGSYASSDKGPGKIFQVPDKKRNYAVDLWNSVCLVKSTL